MICIGKIMGVRIARKCYKQVIEKIESFNSSTVSYLPNGMVMQPAELIC